MDDKLNEALKVIREECKKHQHGEGLAYDLRCSECPLRTGQCSCYITSTNLDPAEWELVSDNEEKTVPKLFL